MLALLQPTQYEAFDYGGTRDEKDGRKCKMDGFTDRKIRRIEGSTQISAEPAFTISPRVGLAILPPGLA